MLFVSTGTLHETQNYPSKANSLMAYETELISNCCGAVIYADYDICATCGEHCAAVDADGKEYILSNKWEPATE